jgi:hypothetical protein
VKSEKLKWKVSGRKETKEKNQKKEKKTFIFIITFSFSPGLFLG